MDLVISKNKVFKAIRDYFNNTDAYEVITDILQDYPNLDPNIYPIECEVFNEKNEKFIKYLHTSPEIQMKKLLSKYKKDIYQITKVFRNFEGSKKHKIEFIMLEWYRVGYNLEDLMEDTQNIFIETAIALYKKPVIQYKGKKYDLRKVEKISVDEAFYKFTKVYPEDYENLLRFLHKKEGLKKEIDYEEAYFRVYAFYVEPNLGKDKLTFIYDYPPTFSAFAKIENGKGKRFEAYINGIELVNGYYELTDPIEQEKRFKEDIEKKEKETGKKYEIDKEFIDSLKNMPKSSGASLGIDRLLMILLNKEDIKEVNYLYYVY
ncbi:elongation factor P--(R)-beta-lysine ligase [Hydrogenothermus marinus]|uniref:Lysyl-tRNA synthetase class 2 n=1 Tax=Hydrogenothermus marinus TaxID=133270 RepID=A0A3M0BJ85_9AQUI|nr:elongation factor P--(R)-beta-lysine ligase [Hydrogenothermus marinus]RMA97227.1 lysyl-tRNA synthetase class 2 [Hydrogenothermus marinus]